VSATPEPAPQRPNRRATDRDPRDSPQARTRKLVRFLASDPENVQWLAHHNAKILDRAAQHLDLAGQPEAASRLRHIARGQRNGESSPF
jgi:hypothetical protein